MARPIDLTRLDNFVRARATSQANACINNLRQIDAAVNEWALERGKKTGDGPASLTSDLTPDIKLNANGSIPECPAGGSYTVGTVGATPQVTCNLSNTVNPPHQLP